jgi:hypothetical protein
MVCRSLRDSWCPPTPATIQRINNNGQPQAALPPDEGGMLAAIGLIVQLGWIDLRVGRQSIRQV